MEALDARRPLPLASPRGDALTKQREEDGCQIQERPHHQEAGQRPGERLLRQGKHTADEAQYTALQQDEDGEFHDTPPIPTLRLPRLPPAPYNTIGVESQEIPPTSALALIGHRTIGLQHRTNAVPIPGMAGRANRGATCEYVTTY
jgi:hypothetical protein